MNDYHINVIYSEEDGGYGGDLPDSTHAQRSARVLRKRWQK